MVLRKEVFGSVWPFIITTFSVEDGLNSTEFRDFIRTATEAAVGNLGQLTVDDVANAVIFQFSPWPHIDNLISNRERIMDVSDSFS